MIAIPCKLHAVYIVYLALDFSFPEFFNLYDPFWILLKRPIAGSGLLARRLNFENLRSELHQCKLIDFSKLIQLSDLKHSKFL